MADETETLHHVRTLSRRLPKAQLHLHLDGSLSPTFLATQALQQNIPLPVPPAQLRSHLLALKAQHGTVQSSGKNWRAFDICNAYLQTLEALRTATSDVVRRLLACNTRVIEIRFCPALHVRRGLSLDEVVEAVVKGYKIGVGDEWVRGGIIVAALRSCGVAHVQEMAHVARRWYQKGVIGMDIAGDEGSYNLSQFANVLQAVELPLTLHAGEWGADAKQNVSDAVKIGAARIGHALAAGGDETLCKLIREKAVYVEACLTANCSGRGRVEKGRFDLHPIKWMLERDVAIAAFSCDNLLLSGTEAYQADPVEEIVRARVGSTLSWRQIARVLKNGARASFDRMTSERECQSFLDDFERQVDAVLADVLQQEQG